MAKSIDKSQNVYVVLEWDEGKIPEVVGVHPNKDDAEKQVWNIQRDINYATGWDEIPASQSKTVWRCGSENPPAYVMIQQRKFPEYVFIKGWTEDHRQILSDGSIKTVDEYVVESDRYIESLKNSRENKIAQEYESEVRRILAALGLPERTFVNDYVDLEELHGVTKESVKTAAEILGVNMDPTDHVVGAARKLRDREATFKSVAVGDFVRIFHPFGDGSYMTMGQVLQFSNKEILIHERALDETHFHMPNGPSDHKSWIAVDVWVPFERKEWYDPAYYHISKDEAVPKVPADVEIELPVAKSGVVDHNGNMITLEALRGAAEKFEAKVVETEHGAELVVKFNPKQPSASQIERQKYA